MAKILVRIDDVCPTMSRQQWDKAIRLLNNYNVKPLLGVVHL